MLYLGLDTSTLTLSLALLRRDGQPQLAADDAKARRAAPEEAFTEIEHVTVGPPKKQSEILPGAIGELMSRHGAQIKDLKGIAVGIGPGSFTGLRIGLASAKAFSYAHHIPLVGVSSLKAAATQGPPDKTLFVIAVARVDDLYLGRYVATGERLSEEEALSPTELYAKLTSEPDAVVMGPAAVEYGAKLVKLGLAPDRVVPKGAVPNASALVRLATWPTAYDEKTTFSLEPHYIRTSGAEMNPKFPPLPGVDPVSRIKDS